MIIVESKRIGTGICHLFLSKKSKKRVLSCRCREIYISLPHVTMKSTLMTHAGHRAYKKVDQRNRPYDPRHREEMDAIALPFNYWYRPLDYSQYQK